MQSVEILQARERCSVDVLVPDLAHGNTLVKGAGRAVLEGDPTCSLSSSSGSSIQSTQSMAGERVPSSQTIR